MDQSGFALPILPGRAAAARTFHAELEGRRKAEYIRSERTRGIVKELWFLQETPNGDIFVVYLESPDLTLALDQLAASREAFDVWFKRQLAHVTGVDLNLPVGQLSWLVSHYEAMT